MEDRLQSGADPVSYTHLDVYKRQVRNFECRGQAVGKESAGGRGKRQRLSREGLPEVDVQILPRAFCRKWDENRSGDRAIHQIGIISKLGTIQAVSYLRGKIGHASPGCGGRGKSQYGNVVIVVQVGKRLGKRCRQARASLHMGLRP